MNRHRTTFLVYVDLDPITPDKTETKIDDILQEYFRPYNPSISLAPYEAQLPHSVEARARRAFLVYLDLDIVADVMYDDESARFMLQRVLESTMYEYKPSASIAPSELQPKKED